MSKKIKRKKRSFLNRFIKGTLDFGIFLLLVLLLTFILSKYVVERIVIQNHSMETTIYPNDSILIDKISYKFSEPKRYDIVVFKQKGTSNELIKRIIGLPHETIQIIDKDIYINGEKIEDVKNLDSIDFAGNASVPITLSEGEYFVLGDNRKDSIDSRYDEIGLVTDTRIIGRCFMRLFPINRIRIF